MAAASLVRDRESNLKEAAFRKAGRFVEYEFAFPYRNEDLGDSFWQLGKAYQLAVLVGPSEQFNGVTGDTWMSDQIYIRLGSPSSESIYHPPYLPEGGTLNRQEHSHRGADEQKGKKR
ncbi:MAG TPA: hypothetical protein VNL14_23335 [Candidatus Acidoferrales bacterium]|nr:hypothetical protein [Candidatus Acidoferrales bacterium]